MLIDLSIVVLVSILYYLLCSLSRVINLIGGMLLIFIFCWAVGVNITYETEVSELEFVMIVIIINVWITVHIHHLVTSNHVSRMSRFHHHRHNDHIYSVRNRLNNFRLKSIKDRFKATPKVYVRTMKHQFDQLNDYVTEHSKYHHMNELVASLAVLQSEIDGINYHLDLPMQINFPHGLKRLLHQYRQILDQYQAEVKIIKSDRKILNIFTHGMNGANQNYTYLQVNLRFPYQRLIHDRIKHQVDLLVINHRGVFVFTLLNCKARSLTVNQNDEVPSQDIDAKQYHDFRSVINLKNKLNVDFDTVNYLIPDKFNIMPHVGIVCTNPKVKINLEDPNFKIILPQNLESLVKQVKPVLNDDQVKEISQDFRDCVSTSRKYEWPVFKPNFKHTIRELLWYQDQVKKLDHKLTF